LRAPVVVWSPVAVWYRLCRALDGEIAPRSRTAHRLAPHWPEKVVYFGLGCPCGAGCAHRWRIVSAHVLLHCVRQWDDGRPGLGRPEQDAIRCPVPMRSGSDLRAWRLGSAPVRRRTAALPRTMVASRNLVTSKKKFRPVILDL